MKTYAPLIAILPFLAFLSKVYYDRVGGFSFGDEWHNFMTAFFMLKGRLLYGEIFNNHQMLASYISFALQKILHPETLYALVLYHRASIIVFSFLFALLLVWRFRWIGFGCVLFYEATKYYLFGHLFLPEALALYPLTYLFGLCLFVLQKKHIIQTDLLLSAIFCWFVIFLREPLAPVALLLYGTLLWKAKKKLMLGLSLCIFGMLSFLTFLSLAGAILEYIYQVVFFNLEVFIPIQDGAPSSFIAHFLKAFFYPFYILLDGKWNYFRLVLIGESLLFLFAVAFVLFLFRRKSFPTIGFITMILGISGLRFVAPGSIFFETFHMIAWHGLFLMSTFFLVNKVVSQKHAKRFGLGLLFLTTALFGFIVSPKSFIWEKVNKDELFTINYAHFYIQGEVIAVLSDPKDTLFADMWDYFIHWQANLDSSYPYALYSFTTSRGQKFYAAREKMFVDTPPDFYYTYCPKDVYASPYVEKAHLMDYTQLYRNGKPTCTYVKKEKISLITDEQWEKAKTLGFSLSQ